MARVRGVSTAETDRVRTTAEAQNGPIKPLDDGCPA